MQTKSFAWDLFRHYLLSRRAGAVVRTVAWLCMVAVSLGVLTLVVVISVMNGFNDQIRKRLLSAEPHLTVHMPINQASAEAIYETPAYKITNSWPGAQVEVYENQDVILRTVDGLFGGAIAKGIEALPIKRLMDDSRQTVDSETKLEGGTFSTPPLSNESSAIQAGEVLLGVDLARGLGIFEGDTVTIIAPEALLLPSGEAPPFERVLVKGLITTNLPDIDSKLVFYRRGLSFHSLKNSASRETGIEVKLAEPEKFQDLKEKLLGSGAQVESWVDRNAALFFALRMEKLVMGSFLGLSALIASFSIVTVLVLVLTQKRKDIGLLMALGLSPKTTRWLFVRVGLFLSVLGIGTGLIGGIVLCLVIDKNPIPLLPEIYYDTTIPAKIDPLFIVAIILWSGTVAFLAAWLPARAVTQESPSSALRGAARGSTTDERP
jgi:lipoprotein-releasing system permease protein